MPLSDYLTFSWEHRHLLTPQQRSIVVNYFSPLDPETNTLYSPAVQAEIIAEWSEFFFGFKELGPHYHVRTKVPEFHKNIYRDFTNEERFYYITSPSGFGKCIHEDTEIPLADGTRKPIKDIQRGDSIFSKAIDQKCEIDTVEFLWNRGKKKCLKLITRSGREIITTPEHKFYTINGWKPLHELSIKDRIATPRRTDFCKYHKINPSIEASKFLMYMIMEGALSSTNCSFTTANDEILLDFTSVCTSLGFSIHKKKGNNYDYQIANGGRALADKHGLYGKTSKEKRFPRYFFTLPYGQKKELLRVLFGTDGYITKQGGVGIQLANRALIEDVYYFMLSIGVHGSIYKRQTRLNGKLYKSWEWFTFNKVDVLKLAKIGAVGKDERCAFVIDKKNKLKHAGSRDVIPVGWQKEAKVNTSQLRRLYGIRVDTHNKPTGYEKLASVADVLPANKFIHEMLHSDIYWDEIKSIEYVGECNTYDIQTAKNKNFVAAGMFVHNTTVACLIYPLYRAFYKLDPYITVGGSTQSLSEEEHLFNIKFEIEDNELLILFYGELKPKNRMSRILRPKPWSASEIELENGVYVRALGCLGKIRGRKRANQRPTLVIVDDPETAEDVESEALLRKHHRWLFRDVFYRIDKDYGKIRIIGNMLSDSCLIATLKRDKAWRGVDFSAIDENGRSIWEEQWPTEALLREQELAIQSGRFEEFMHERMNKPVKSLTRRLEGHHIVSMTYMRRHDQNLLIINNDTDNPIVVNMFIGIDPEVDADNVGPRAFMIIARGMVKQSDGITRDCLFVFDYLYKPLEISDVVDNIAEQHQKYFMTGVAIEINSVQRIFRGYIEKYTATDPFYQRWPFQKFYIKNYSVSKIKRILRLQPKFNNGQVYINGHMKELLLEARDFGSFKKDGLHLLDALEMADRNAYPPHNENVRDYNVRSLHPDYYAGKKAPSAVDSLNWRQIPIVKF